MTDYRIDYEADGHLTALMPMIVMRYIMAAIALAMGIWAASALSGALLLVGLAAAAWIALSAYKTGKLELFWNDEKFTVIRAFDSPVTHSFDDMKKVEQQIYTITLIMYDGKRYVVPRWFIGFREFFELLQEKAD
ncbi:MAG: hypothetical protein ACI4XF_12410 [Oscillospiraceae bacterium]